MLAIVFNGNDKKDIFGVFSSYENIEDGIMTYYSSYDIIDPQFTFTDKEINFKCKLNNEIELDRVFTYKRFKLNELFED